MFARGLARFDPRRFNEMASATTHQRLLILPLSSESNKLELAPCDQRPARVALGASG